MRNILTSLIISFALIATASPSFAGDDREDKKWDRDKKEQRHHSKKEKHDKNCCCGKGCFTPIRSVPFSITEPGVYCLGNDLHYSASTGNAITVDSDNVVIDLNGRTLSGSTESTTEAHGVRAETHQNITIRNGTFQGFWIGISLEGSGHLVEDTRVVSSTWNAILINSGKNNIIRNNHVASTGGTTAQGVNNAFGIVVFGEGSTVMNNDVADTSNVGETYGIWLGGDHFAVNNRVSNAQFGVFYNFGAGKYRDNLTLNVNAPYSGGVDAGNNH